LEWRCPWSPERCLRFRYSVWRGFRSSARAISFD
jgi:hypothetical protein